MTKIERIELEKKEKEKRDKELKELEMRCDICKLGNFNEVFILRKDKFSKKCPKQYFKANRVCWDCAKWLFKSGFYNFGTNWKNIFFYQMGFSRTNAKKYREKREKYMVIHA